LRLSDLTYLMFMLNSLIDRGAHAGISMEVVKEHIADGDVFSWLTDRFPADGLDLSHYRPEVAKEINEKLNDILGGYDGSERRKWGVENNGICLLLAWIAELIQQRAWADQ